MTIPPDPRPELGRDPVDGPLGAREAELAAGLEAYLAGRLETPPGPEGPGLRAAVEGARAWAQRIDQNEAPRAAAVAAEVLGAVRERSRSAQLGERRPTTAWQLLGQSLCRSVALRVLAASLLLHLLALPAIGLWLWLPEPGPAVTLTFVPAAEGQGVEALEAAPTPSAAGPAAGPSAEDRLRLERFRLHGLELPPQLGLEGDRRSAAHWFGWRAELHRSGRRFLPTDLALDCDGPTAVSALLEAALDLWVLDPQDPLAERIARRMLAEGERMGGASPSLQASLERARELLREPALMAPAPSLRTWFERLPAAERERPPWDAVRAWSLAPGR
jgi:hypothetical protein